MPGEEVWLIGEHRSNGERKYYLSNLPPDTPLKALAGTVKARWVCEQAHQQLKEELGLDHFEGRSWTGLHRHALMTMIAYAFLQSRRLQQAGGGKKNRRSSATTDPASGPSGDHQLSHQAISTAMSALLQATQSPATQSAKVVLAPRQEASLSMRWRPETKPRRRQKSAAGGCSKERRSWLVGDGQHRRFQHRKRARNQSLQRESDSAKRAPGRRVRRVRTLPRASRNMR